MYLAIGEFERQAANLSAQIEQYASEHVKRADNPKAFKRLWSTGKHLDHAVRLLSEAKKSILKGE